MSEPRNMALGDWALTVLAGIVVGIIVGLGSAIAWFSGSKERIYKRIEEVELDVEKLRERTGEYEAQMAVLTACQLNTSSNLAEVLEMSKATNQKLDNLVWNLLDKKPG